jgi:ADP-ribosylglycohydrolase
MIGAAMRAAVCGALAPGNPRKAAELAWKDGRISHHNNGILAEVFNAVLVSMCGNRHEDNSYESYESNSEGL